MKRELWYIANYRMPTDRAHGLQVAKMCEAFCEAGIRVTLVVPRRGRPLDDIFRYYNLSERFTVVHVPVMDLTGRVARIGFLIQSVTFAFSVLRLLARERYTGLVYSRDQFSLFVASLFRNNALVYEMHTMPGRVFFLHRRLFRKIRTFVAISHGLADDLVALGITRERIHVAPDAYDPRDFAQGPDRVIDPASLGLPRDKILVAYTGSLSKWKGVHTLALAARQLDERYHVAVIGGTDAEAKAYRIFVSRLPVKNLTVIPRISQREVVAYVRAAHILVLPNSGREAISRRYTSPMKFFYYLASGKPIVASDLPSLHEIGDRFPGVFYCRPDDSADLARMIQLVNTAQTYTRDMSRDTWRERANSLSRLLF